jgi:hypothetical protein
MAPKKAPAAAAATTKRAREPFQPVEIAQGDREAVNDMLLKGEPGYPARARLWTRFFDKYIEVNAGHRNVPDAETVMRDDELYAFFEIVMITQMRRAEELGFDPIVNSSIETYIRTLRRHRQEKLHPNKSCAEACRKCLSKERCHVKINHAVDMPDDMLVEIAEAMLLSENPTLGVMAAIQLSLGIRHADGCKILRRDLIWRSTEGNIVCDVTEAKNIQSPSDTQRLVIPQKLRPIFSEPMEAATVAYLEEDPDVPLYTIDLDTYNKAIKAASPHGIGTSYTFRRNYIKRVLESTELEANEPDFKAAVRYTLHHDVKSLKAHYTTKVYELKELKGKTAPLDEAEDD